MAERVIYLQERVSCLSDRQLDDVASRNSHKENAENASIQLSPT